VRRASGDPPPWTDDPILQRGRFLNVFREDDRGSQALIRFATPVKDNLPDLIQALFFARWCNRQSTLDALHTDQLQDSAQLQHTLHGLPDPPWCNVTAYPVQPVTWGGRTHSRFDAATELFGQIKQDLTEMILAANGDVIEATRTVNAAFQMANDFPIFMAVMDIAWFRPDVIDPASHVPTGIGAVPYLDRLQQHLGLQTHEDTCDKMIALQSDYWPEAKRAFQPIDIEYLSCECRKYYSYQNGTKAFEGKNVFQVGQSPRMEFDIDRPSPNHPQQTQIHVIAGGPCSGKTTVLQALAAAGHTTIPETARVLLEAGIQAGHTAEQLRSDPVAWQRRVFLEDHAIFDALPTDTPVFADTSLVEDLVFGARAGLFAGPNLTSWLQHKRYKTVFFLDPLEAYETSDVRIESQQMARQISEQVWSQYRALGYHPVPVPAGPIKERVALILSTIQGLP